MGLADRPYMQERARQREQAGRGNRWRMRWLIDYPLVWIAALLLLYVAATLIRPHLPNDGAGYCYVWTDYCLP